MKFNLIGLFVVLIWAAAGFSSHAAPAPPSGLTATSVSNSQINLRWLDNSSNEFGFNVFRSTDNITFTRLVILASNITTYSDTGLNAQTTYYYEVQSFDFTGDSAFTNTASARTGGGPTGPPLAPSGLVAAAMSGSQINLTWLDNSNNESGFSIARSVDNATFNQITTVGSGITSFINTGLSPTTTYYYKVRSFNASWNSTYSNTAQATTRAASSSYYVSTTGSDTAGGTAANPWRTLRHALTSLQPGNQLTVRGGTYVEQLTNISIHPGTASSPITVSAYPGERPVLQGLLWLTRPSYWTINGLNVTWNSATSTSSQHMVKITNGVGWVYTNSELWGARSYAGMLITSSISGEPANWTISHNCIHDTYTSNGLNQDHLIYINTGLSAGSGLIAHNILYNATNGEGIKLGGADSTTGTVNVIVTKNTIYNTSQSILVAWMSHNNQIYQNILFMTTPGNPCIHAFNLTGAGNVAHDNAGGSAGLILFNDEGFSPIADQGGDLFPINPQFDSLSPTGFHPQNTSAQQFGAYAP